MSPSTLLHFVITIVLYACSTCIASESDTCDDINKVFSFPINDLSNPKTQTVISDAVESFTSNIFYFKINNFLSEYGLSMMQQLINSDDIKSKIIHKELQKTIFGENMDYDNFPNDTKNGNTIHPRNMFVNVKLSMVRAGELPSIMMEIFEYEPLLNFFSQIVIKSGKFKNLYLSNDTDGSIYLFMYNNGDFGEWHFDQHPFTCVIMLSKPPIGGRYLYYHNASIHKHDHTQWNWDIIGQIMRNETSAVQQYVNFIEANEGDMYCHTGNITMHRTEQSFNTQDVDHFVRTILVLSYADRDGFKHDDCRVANDACDYINIASQ